jgi:ubiquitin C-terminal hydrolase
MFYLPLSLSDLKLTNIQMLFDSYFLEETLENENKYFCSICKSKQKAKKNCFVKKSPEYLILCLNRFSKDQKLHNQYDYSSEIKITSCDNNLTSYFEYYELISIVIHSGPCKSSGHYYMSFKNDQDWICIDDKTNFRYNILENSNYHTPYILFYQRKIANSQANQINIHKQISELITSDNRAFLMEISNQIQS